MSLPAYFAILASFAGVFLLAFVLGFSLARSSHRVDFDSIVIMVSVVGCLVLLYFSLSTHSV